MQAAEKALGSLRTMHGQSIQRWQSSPRPFQGFSNKRLKQEHPQILQGFASSGRYPRNAQQFLDRSNRIFNLTCWYDCCWGMHMYILLIQQCEGVAVGTIST